MVGMLGLKANCKTGSLTSAQQIGKSASLQFKKTRYLNKAQRIGKHTFYLTFNFFNLAFAASINFAFSNFP